LSHPLRKLGQHPSEIFTKKLGPKLASKIVAEFLTLGEIRPVILPTDWVASAERAKGAKGAEVGPYLGTQSDLIF
jgi:hypothetical protein